MKTILAFVVLALCCAGCTAMDKVNFTYFNLGTNEIIVDSITGLPPWASPGVLIPTHAEDRLSEKRATSYDEPVAVSATLKIVWREEGISHEAEFKRDDLGIPAKIKNGRIIFSYLGENKWRIKVFK